MPDDTPTSPKIAATEEPDTGGEPRDEASDSSSDPFDTNPAVESAESADIDELYEKTNVYMVSMTGKSVQAQHYGFSDLDESAIDNIVDSMESSAQPAEESSSEGRFVVRDKETSEISLGIVAGDELSFESIRDLRDKGHTHLEINASGESVFLRFAGEDESELLERFKRDHSNAEVEQSATPLNAFGTSALGETDSEVGDAEVEVDIPIGATGEGDAATASGDTSTDTAPGEASTTEATGEGEVTAAADEASTDTAAGEESTTEATGEGDAATASGDTSTDTAVGEESTAEATGEGDAATASGDTSTDTAPGEESTAEATGEGDSAIASGDTSTDTAAGEESTTEATGEGDAATASGDTSTDTPAGEDSTAEATGEGDAATASGDTSTDTPAGEDSTAEATGEGESTEAAAGTDEIPTTITEVEPLDADSKPVAPAAAPPTADDDLFGGSPPPGVGEPSPAPSASGAPATSPAPADSGLSADPFAPDSQPSPPAAQSQEEGGDGVIKVDTQAIIAAVQKDVSDPYDTMVTDVQMMAPKGPAAPAQPSAEAGPVSLNEIIAATQTGGAAPQERFDGKKLLQQALESPRMKKAVEGSIWMLRKMGHNLVDNIEQKESEKYQKLVEDFERLANEKVEDLREAMDGWQPNVDSTIAAVIIGKLLVHELAETIEHNVGVFMALPTIEVDSLIREKYGAVPGDVLLAIEDALAEGVALVEKITKKIISDPEAPVNFYLNLGVELVKRVEAKIAPITFDGKDQLKSRRDEVVGLSSELFNELRGHQQYEDKLKAFNSAGEQRLAVLHALIKAYNYRGDDQEEFNNFRDKVSILAEVSAK